MITLVTSAMTKKLISVPLGTTLFEANQLMTEKRIRHLPILSEMDEVIGILSQRDLQYVPNSKNILVEMMMSTPVRRISDNAPLRTAIFEMLQNKISSVLVSDEDDVVVGIVTTDDLLWHLAHLLVDEENDKMDLAQFNAKRTIGEVAQELSQAGI